MASIFQQTKQHVKQLLPLFLRVYIPLLTFFVVLAIQPEIPIPLLTRDTNAITDMPFYTGILSSIGILLWGATATVCFFTAFIIWDSKDTYYAYFIVASGLFISFLLLDDLLLIHDVVLPDYLNISGKFVFIFYVLFSLIYMWLFRHIIIQTDYVLVLIAGAFFALSIMLDIIADTPNLTQGIASNLSELSHSHYIYKNIKYLLEDGAKLFGILSLFLYFARLCQRQISAHLAPKS